MSHEPAHQPVIDGFEFASAGATKQGVWPLRDFPRLRDMLATEAGEVRYEIKGERDERGRPALRLQVRGTLMLRCQRCLEPMPFEVRTDETLVLAATWSEPMMSASRCAACWDSAFSSASRRAVCAGDSFGKGSSSSAGEATSKANPSRSNSAFR